MNVLSLFNGISVGYQSLLEAGIKVDKYYSSEVQESVIHNTQLNFPETIQLGDVTKWREWDLPKIDLIIGGSPCQGFSKHGKGLNFKDPRSKLFFEFDKIVKHFRELNPNMKFLLENVNMKKEWEQVITDYVGVEPIHINSDLLLPHNRPRTYWTDIKTKVPQQVKYKLLDLLEKIELEDYTLVGNVKVCNSFSEKSKELLSYVDGELRVTQPVKKGYAVAEIGDGINISFPSSKTRRGRVIKNRSSCLDTACDIGVYDQLGQVRRFTINELEKLQGLPCGYLKHINDTESKKALGNGWTMDVIAHILKGLKEEE